jgi:hypothetical protein
LVVGFSIPRDPQGSQSVHVFDGCLAARVLLLQFITLWVAPKSSFSNFALVRISHRYALKATVDPQNAIGRDGPISDIVFDLFTGAAPVLTTLTVHLKISPQPGHKS